LFSPPATLLCSPFRLSTARTWAQPSPSWTIRGANLQQWCSTSASHTVQLEKNVHAAKGCNKGHAQAQPTVPVRRPALLPHSPPPAFLQCVLGCVGRRLPAVTCSNHTACQLAAGLGQHHQQAPVPHAPAYSICWLCSVETDGCMRTGPCGSHTSHQHTYVTAGVNCAPANHTLRNTPLNLSHTSAQSGSQHVPTTTDHNTPGPVKTTYKPSVVL
jgi:hypothetical protein